MTPVFKKLNFKDQECIHVVDAPESFKTELDLMKGYAKIISSLPSGSKAQFIIGFCTQQKQVDALANKVHKALDGDGICWFAYPKGTSKKYTCDFNRDNGWSVLGKLGFEGVRMVAIDENWSALRFRKVEYIKKMTRSFAMTDEGKKKIGRTA